ncbi:MAG: hypothetical protein JSW34_08025 [Candidatus Zixiibacteriota bacterium]|nr:MAG: hypothetical protein JSW34_08025 [candidate division Zixibacteria bacterium]
MKGRTATLILVIVLFAAGTALGQLTKADIDSLRQVGEREGWTFRVAENPATKRPMEQLCGTRVPQNLPETPVFAPSAPAMALPSYFDWRDQDGVTPIKNQGGCGSCWAFATVGVLECAIRIKDDITVDLSEQHLVSCNMDGWNCATGGWAAHDYHLINTNPSYERCECGSITDFGPVFEVDYPYTGHDDPCSCPHVHHHEYCIQAWGQLLMDPYTQLPSVEDMKQAIMQYGPIWVCVQADASFSAYDGGVFNNCMEIEPGVINHAVVLVG